MINVCFGLFSQFAVLVDFLAKQIATSNMTNTERVSKHRSLGAFTGPLSTDQDNIHVFPPMENSIERVVALISAIHDSESIATVRSQQDGTIIQAGHPQGDAPTMIRDTSLGSHRVIVGASPCGCPA